MNNRGLLFLAIFLASTGVYAQEISLLPRTKSQFSIEFLNGFGHRRYTQELGQLSNLDKINSTNLLMFKYRYRFSEKFYAEAGWGFGAQIENRQPPIYDFSGFDLWNYDFFPLARVSFSAAYQVYANQRNSSINAKFGFGWNRFPSIGSGSGYTTQDEYFYSRIDVEGQRLPFVTFGFEYVIPSKRKDEFSFYLGYQYASKSYFIGTYTYEQSSVLAARGTHSANMSALQFGIGYTFTRAKKQERMSQEMARNNGDKKEARAKTRFERRAIDPQSQYITLGIGFGVNAVKFRPKNNPFSSPGFGSFVWNGTYERGFKSNLFFDVNYYGFLFWQGAEVKLSPYSSSAWGGNAFTGHFLTAGGQYKIQNRKTNFQFFNIHAGIGLGAHFRPKGDGGLGSGGGTMSTGDEPYSYNYTSVTEVRGNLMPVIYGGISKDIRITERFLLNLTYRHQLGLNNVYATKYVFSDSNNPMPRELNSRIDGTAFFFQFGLKYRIK